MSDTLHKISSHPFIQSSGLKEGVMRPRGLSFPLADHMNRLLSGGIRSVLRPLGLLESHFPLVFSLFVEVRRRLSILLVLRLEEIKRQNGVP